MTMLSRGQAWGVAGLAAIALFFGYTVWGGLPPEEGRSQIFWTQVLIFFAITVVYIAVFWHLLARPLKAGVRKLKPQMIPVRSRQIVTLIVASGGLAIVVGAFWDAVWHRSFGIPLGDDFFWRPHLLMYFGFLSAIVCGFWSLGYLVIKSEGSFQQRFRANPLAGLLVLNAAYLMYGLPADPIWHKTYGADLNAWSVPHFVLFASFLFTLLLGIFAHSSTIPRGEWRSIFKFQFSDFLPLCLFAAMLLGGLQLLLSPFDQLLNGMTMADQGTWIPDGVLPLNILIISTIVGVLGTKLFRCYGLATAAGLAALVIRAVLISLFADPEMFTMHEEGWLAPLIPLLAVDLWAWYSVTRRGQEPEWRDTALVIVVAMIYNCFVIFTLYHPIGMPDLVSMTLAVALGGLGFTWFAYQMAEWMDSKRGAESASAPAVGAAVIRAMSPGISFGIIGAFVVFIVFFILTATPPV